jgi:hypothetical protein
MLRLLFLLLVVIGGLAISLGVIFSVGLARHASSLNRPAEPPATSQPPASQPATNVSPASPLPTAPSATPSIPAPAVPPPPAIGPAAPVVPVAPQAIARPVIVLSPATGYLRGDEIQLEREEVPVLGAWRRVQDYIEWKAVITQDGFYRVEIFYACEDGSGGEFVLRAGSNKFIATTIGTGGWTNFKSAIVGIAELPAGKVRVAIKPSELPIGHALMRLREVRLVPVAEPKP